MERSSPQRFDEELARRIRRIESTLADLRSSSMVRMVTHTHDESQIEAHSTPNLIAEGGSEGLEGELTLTTGANENRVYIDAFWDSIANAKGYEVELLTPDVVTETTGPDGETNVVTENVIVQRNSTESTHIRFDPVEPLTDYVVKVRVIYSNLATPADYLTGSITTGKDETVPEQVTGLSIGEGYKTITATWNEVDDSDVRDGNGQYEIAIATDSEFTEGLRSQRVGGTVASFGDLTPGEALYVRVRAVDSSGNLGPWSAVETATPGDVVVPDPSPSDGVPPASSPTPSVSAGIGFLVAEWQPVENADPITYHVHISTTNGFTPNAGTKHGEINGTTYFIHSTAGSNALVAGTTYYVKVVATDADGSASPGAQGSGVPVAMPEEFELGAGSILEEHLADSAVASAKLKDGAVTTDKITADWLVGNNLVIGGTGTTYATTAHDPTTKATPGDVSTARQEAINIAAADATAKANAAQSAAQQAAALDAQAKADQAEADAKAAAAIDAQSRAEAEAAQAKADATAEAAADAQTKADAAQAAAIAAAEAYADAAVQPANDRLTLWQHADTTFIDGGRIFTDSITANQIAAGAIGVNELAANSVNASKMVTGTITAASGILADAVITTAKIADLAVSTAKIANLNVTAAKIADLNVTTAKIANLNVTEGKIANLAVTTAKVQDAAITNAKIGNLAVDSAKIADAAITTVKIGDAQITNAKVISLAANKLTTDTLTATTITLGTGGIFRAGNTTNGVYFDSNGLRMFKGGVTTVDLPVAGDPTFSGTITGGHVRTAATGRRITLGNITGQPSNEIQFWNIDNYMKAKIRIREEIMAGTVKDNFLEIVGEPNSPGEPLGTPNEFFIHGFDVTTITSNSQVVLHGGNDLGPTNNEVLSLSRFRTVGDNDIVSGARIRSSSYGSAANPIFGFNPLDSGMYHTGSIGGNNGAYLATEGTWRFGVTNFGARWSGVMRSSGATQNNIWNTTGETGVTLNATNGTIQASRDSAGSGALLLNLNGTGNIADFRRSGVQVGWIRVTVANAFYETASDYRIKERATSIKDPIDVIMQLKPYEGYFKADPNNKVQFFFAHEVQEVLPWAVSGEKDQLDEDGNIKPQGIDHSSMVPSLTASIQALVKRVESLENELLQRN